MEENDEQTSELIEDVNSEIDDFLNEVNSEDLDETDNVIRMPELRDEEEIRGIVVEGHHQGMTMEHSAENNSEPDEQNNGDIDGRASDDELLTI